MTTLIRASQITAEATKPKPMKPISHVRVPEYLRNHLDSLSNREGLLSEATIDYPTEFVPAKGRKDTKSSVNESGPVDKRTLAEALLTPGTSKGAFHITDLLNKSNSQSPSRIDRPKSFNRLKLTQPNNTNSV